MVLVSVMNVRHMRMLMLQCFMFVSVRMSLGGALNAVVMCMTMMFIVGMRMLMQNIGMKMQMTVAFPEKQECPQEHHWNRNKKLHRGQVAESDEGHKCTQKRGRTEQCACAR